MSASVEPAASAAERVGGSFRDPAAFVFTLDDEVYRQVNQAGRRDYDRLMTSGLYEKLTSAGDLIPHEEADLALALDERAYKVIRPRRVSFISYPYEWCFSQLKDAALLTLRVQNAAMRLGLSLKDATAYNVQFDRGRPVWIDTLSFEPLEEGAPWVAYRQFCEFFLAPLALMRYTDVRLHQLLRVYLDGVPIEIASRLLPWHTRFSIGLLMHVHLHARAARRAKDAPASAGQRRRMPKNALVGLIDSLDSAVRKLAWEPGGTEWGNYYDETNYTDRAFAHKREIVAAALDRLRPAGVWDLGANNGAFSRVAAERGIPVVSFDLDPSAVEQNYRQVVQKQEQTILPLIMDLTNPSAACGWAGRERESLMDRGPVDLALALALVHHLAIGHNVPFDRLAAFFASVARALVIEFVPKEDSQVQRMLSTRQDVFADYTADAFERAFAGPFRIEQAIPVTDSARTMYVMARR
jgi:ribosomal protein L11 methylase PrmA